ncbi:MAG: hypothetical protein BWK73_19050 [Thiothrix lacustris]|uniref:Uncharacterized protein n=1 Tax=Thiothrix lacustris TaxID=525917 RepID=A0A1Y1QPR6_9GAMM|nr:MAG: hypothetical protein BWK73_19050 [Thiothrix lacustris]
MGQLVIKRVPWWGSHAKQLVIWGPIAAVQASTLAGLGYFYQRLNALEASELPPPAPSVLTSTLQDVKPFRVVRTSRIPLPPPPVMASAPLMPTPVVLNTSTMTAFTRVGQDFSTASASPPQQHVTKRKAVLKPKPIIKTNKAAKPSDDERVAQANRAEVFNKPALSDNSPLFVSQVQPNAAVAEPVAMSEELQRGKPLPVGIVVWVYLGELREQGWHGQRLHLASNSGLPMVGEQYRTQKIHGIYDQPYGNRSMGGFQKGDLVSILEVRHESNAGVWAKVRKVRSVGKPGCVECTQ